MGFGILIQYIVSLLPLLLGPPAGVYLLLQVSSLNPPWFAVLPLCLASLPIAFVCRVKWEVWRDERAAERLGATLPPTVADTSIYGRNLLKAMVNNFHHGYLGTSLYGL